jgi:methionine-rich copper-binding protein CopC
MARVLPMNIRAATRVVSIALLAGVSTNPFAHVLLDRAVPTAGSIVHGSPAEVRLRFTHAIEAAFSTVEVLDINGRRVDKLDHRVEPSDPTVLRVSLTPLPPGTYRVNWRAVSVDTHVINGNYTFAVQP